MILWLRIIALITGLIAEGLSKNEAIEQVSKLFNVSVEEIKKWL